MSSATSGATRRRTRQAPASVRTAERIRLDGDPGRNSHVLVLGKRTLCGLDRGAWEWRELDGDPTCKKCDYVLELIFETYGEE